MLVSFPCNPGILWRIIFFHLQVLINMWPLIRIELFKIFKKPRTYIAFAAIAAIVFLVQMALYVDGQEYLGFATQSFEQTFQVGGIVLNGYFVCLVILQ